MLSLSILLILGDQKFGLTRSQPVVASDRVTDLASWRGHQRFHSCEWHLHSFSAWPLHLAGLGLSTAG